MSVATVLVLATLAFADPSPCPTDPSEALPQGEALYRIHQKAALALPELSTTDETYAAAPCRRTALPRSKTYTDHYSRLEAIGPAVDAEVLGISFRGESPKLIELFRTLTTHSGYCPAPAGVGCQRPIPRGAGGVPQSCFRVSCALESLFGKAEAHRVIYLLSEFGLNSSLYAHSPGYAGEVFKNWKADEIDDVVMALSDMPQSLKTSFSNKQFNRRKIMREELTGGGATLADARMTFNDLWSDQDRSMRRTTAFHEFAHNYSERFSLDRSDAWRNLGGWSRETVAGRPEWISRKPQSLISRYAASDPAEDFAECVTAYRYDAETLRRASPEKYAFIRDLVFRGTEFRRGSRCVTAPTLASNWEEEMRARISAWRPPVP